MKLGERAICPTPEKSLVASYGTLRSIAARTANALATASKTLPSGFCVVTHCEPTTPPADEASADPAPDARERGGDAKSAGGKSFYDSLEQEMASLLNRPSSKP